jgi:hypothetical protein
VNNFVTERRLDARLYLPFNLPQARLDPDTAQPVAFVSLLLGQRLRLAWLNLHLVRVLGDSFTAPTKANPSLAASYTGLYGGRANYITEPTGQPLSYTACDIPGVGLFNPVFYEDVSAPDVYSVIVVNNFKDAQIDVCVSGSFMVEIY